MKPSIGKYQSLKGCTALITGASRGIGAEFALQLARLGVNLVLTARDSKSLLEVKKKIVECSDVVVDTISVDLADQDSSDRILSYALGKHKRIDMFVNNAGLLVVGKFLSNSVEDYDNLLRVNVVAATSLLRRCVEHMVAHRQPSYIVNIGSLAGFGNNPNHPIYAASKVYMKQISQCLSMEYRETNLSITHVAPGRVATGFAIGSVSGSKCGHRGQSISPEELVKKSIEGMLKRKFTVIPGNIASLKSILLTIIPNIILIWLIKLLRRD